LGAGLGLASVFPMWRQWTAPDHFGYMAAAWFIITEWLSSALGGYLTGRLRTRWLGVHTHEVFFRDTAHGLLTWSVATVFYTVLVLSVASAAIDVFGHGSGTAGEGQNGSLATNAYYIDSLYRTDRSVAVIDSGTKEETTRIIWKGIGEGYLSNADETYLAHLVSAHTGLSEADAKKKIDGTVVQFRQSVNSASKTAATISIFTSVAMLIGAFIACIAAAMGGMQRDEPHPIG